MVSNIKQYILLSDICNNVIYVDSYHCEKDVLDKIDKLSPVDNNPIYMAIINLKFMTPSFIHYINKYYDHPHDSHVTYYNCYKNKKHKMF